MRGARRGTRRIRWIVLSVLLAASGLLVHYLVGLSGDSGPDERHRPEKRSRDTRGPFPRLTWEEDARQEYDLALDAKVLVSSDGGEPLERRQMLTGRLHLRVLTSEDSVVQVVFQVAGLALTGADWQPDATQQLSHPFVAEFAADGQLHRVLIPPEVNALARQQLEGILRTFAVVVPPTAEMEWMVEETDTFGRYTASYAWDGEEEITKRKTKYASSASDGLSTGVSVTRSLARVRILPTVSWIDRIVVDEALRRTLAGRASIASVVVASLERRPLSTPSGLAIDGDAADLLASSRESASRETPPTATREPPSPPRAEPTPKEIAAFRDGLRTFDESGGRERSVVFELRRLLREYPALADSVLDLLDDPALEDATIAELFHLLEVVGTPEAQRVLQQVIEDPARDHQNRLRAVIAIGGTWRPTTDSVEALWRVVEQRVDARSVDVSNTAALSLGRMGSQLRELEPHTYESLRDGLLGRLRSAAHELAVANTLSSIGNTCDSSLAADIEPYLGAESTHVRDAAASAMGSLPSTEAATSLARRLPHERHGGVRSSMVESLRRLEAWDEQVAGVVNDLALREPDAQARFAMVRYLAESLDVFPAGRRNLELLLERDSSERIRVYLARKLLGSASDG